MPVHRDRRIDDVPPPPPRDPLDPVATERMWALLRGATLDLPPLFAAGVRRYASVEAADADRRAAEVARMRRGREAHDLADRSAGPDRGRDPHG